MSNLEDEIEIGRERDYWREQESEETDREARMRAVNTALRADNERLRALLVELSDYFDNYSDVEDSERGIAERPNEEMQWKQRIDAEAGRQR